MKLRSWLALFACSAFVVTCGGSPSVDDEKGGGKDDDDSAEGADGGADDDGRPGGGGDSDGLVGEDDDPPDGCEPVTCEERGKDCGPMADGCGEVIECGECDDGAICGLLERNVCTAVDEETLCVPLTKNQACRGIECGSEGDGCGGTYDCGECPEGEECGLLRASKCDAPPEGGETGCETEITSCEEAGVECGQTGNGCGGLLDCNAEGGGCAEGEICGAGGPQQCGTFGCEPLEPEDACADSCGIVSNGCGVEVDGVAICMIGRGQHAGRCDR